MQALMWRQVMLIILAHGTKMTQPFPLLWPAGAGNNRLDRIVLRKIRRQIPFVWLKYREQRGCAALPALTAYDMPSFTFGWRMDWCSQHVSDLDIHDERIMHLPAPHTRSIAQRTFFTTASSGFQRSGGWHTWPEGWQFNRVAGAITGVLLLQQLFNV